MNLGMLKLFRVVFILVLAQALFASTSNDNFDFDFVKKGKQDNNTLLIVGGIQGDEPGGFMAATIVATHYKIKKGSVWVVPNLNFYSIIKRSRGPYGDMNRKFAKISTNDPDYEAIERIKKYITSPEVKVVLNLHDGSGFYRDVYESWTYSPDRWGQSSIIDQSNIDVDKYGNLEEISKSVCDYVNGKLLNNEHYYKVKNTKTRMGDKEMEKSLTYFAINHGKAAFGNEASKDLRLPERTYYHLLALEKYMHIMGIEFDRGFDLNPKDVKRVINNDVAISFYNNKIQLPLGQVRGVLGYFPMKKDEPLSFTTSSPLIAVLKDKKNYVIHYGNRTLAYLKPEFMDIADSTSSAQITIDGKKQKVEMGSIIDVDSSFNVEPKDGVRVNVIGFVQKGKDNEAGINIKKSKFIKRFSIDKKGNLYRVEFYKGDKFAGMILVNFDKSINSEDLSASSFTKKVTLSM